MEAFFTWLFQNIAWDTLKQALPKAKQRELALLQRALSDSQNRIDELEEERRLIVRLVEQRNRAIAEVIHTKRKVRQLERELASIKRKKG